jgi:hypothetical protein
MIAPFPMASDWGFSVILQKYPMIGPSPATAEAAERHGEAMQNRQQFLQQLLVFASP